MKTKRIISLSLPRFSTDRVRRRQPAGGAAAAVAGAPLALVTEERGRPVLAAIDGAAAAAGLVPGLPLTDARALCPGLATRPLRAGDDARAVVALAGWCGRYSPWTAPDTGGSAACGHGVWLDISGCAHLFGGEAALLADLAGRMRSAGFDARAAVADSAGAAWAVARFATAPDARACTVVVPPGDQRAALAPLPVAALRLPVATVDALSRLGLRRIGDLLPLPRAALAARFRDGRSGARGHALLPDRLDQALGRLAEPLSAWNARLGRPSPPLECRLALPGPVGRIADVMAALERLLASLCARLAATGQGARRLELALFRTDATADRFVVGTSRPNRDAGHLRRLFAERLDGASFGGRHGEGVDLIVLAAPEVGPLPPGQKVFDGAGRDAGGPGVAALVDRLVARLGAGNVGRLLPRESHLPERATRPAPPLARSPVQPARPVRPVRPVRLLSRPERIVMTLAADERPLRFRWRRTEHRLARAEGPERIAPEWWRAGSAGRTGSTGRTGRTGSTGASQGTRDYYRVEDREGRRYWLFRRDDDWFLHGLFA